MQNRNREEKQAEVETQKEIFSFSENQIEEIRTAALQKARETVHRWRQKGPYLVCTSCPFPHATWLGNDKQMVGEENGIPIIKPIEIKQT